MSPLTLTTEQQVAALFDPRYGVHLLAHFLSEQTISGAAARLGEPAPRTAYHVGKLQRLGLLEEVRRRGRQRWLRVVSAELLVPPELLTPQSEELIEGMLLGLVSAYLEGVRQQARNVEVTEPLHLDLRQLDAGAGPGGMQPLLRFRSLRLTPQVYQQALAAAWQVIENTPSDPPQQGQLCTLALLAFPGSPLPMAEGDGDA